MNIEEQVNEEIMMLQNKIWAREGMPTEVIRTIEKIKERLKSIENEQKIDLSRTYEYANSQFEILEEFLKNRIGERRKSKKIGDIIKEVRNIHNKSNDEFSKYVIEKGKEDDEKEATQVTGRILMSINDLLENIYAGQKRMLNSQGYKQNDIEKMMYEVKGIMQKYIGSKSKENIENTFMLDNEEIRNLEIETISNINKIKQKNQKDKEEFKKELKLNSPTLSEQKESALKRNIESKNQNTKNVVDEEKSLPSDVLK